MSWRRRRDEVVRRRRDVVVRRRDDVVTATSWRRRRDEVVRRRRDDNVRRRRTYITGFSVIFLCKYLSVFLTRCCYTVNVFILRCFTYLLAYLARPVRRRHVVVVRRRDDVVTTTSSRRRHDDVVRRRREDDVRRRRRTYIIGFSVTFLCKYLSVFLTRCFYTVNEFHRCFTYVLAYLLTLSSVRRTTSYDVVRRTTTSWQRRETSWRRRTTTSYVYNWFLCYILV